jgi:hypothetical protein
VRNPAFAGRSPELARISDELGFLAFKKPKNEADIVRTTTFFTFFLPGDIRIAFVDEVLIQIGRYAFLR